ncbi:aquaporin-like protein [Calycina marina]|uniref:Aquaporin-like protein n=1 Tax=Calycina marina TaxID=1763456 RepID=A0A9P7Z5X7_9HELO|nr:aquaporin-like protein [Calycina marina]
MKTYSQRVFAVLPPSARGHVVASIGELIGTTSFLFLGFAGVHVAEITSKPIAATATGKEDSTVVGLTSSALLYIALAMGFSLMVNAWIFFRISGGLFNPIVSMGMVLIGALSLARGVLLIAMQTAGAIIAAYIVDAIFPGTLNVGCHLHPEVTVAQGVLIEMLLTALLVFTIFMLAAERHESTAIAPIGIGVALFIVHLVGVFWTGAAVNPPRALAPAIVTRTFVAYHWIYYVGPIAGGLLAVILYKLIKALEYETVQQEV